MDHLHEDKIKELELTANEIRLTIIEALVTAGSGHTAGPLGMTDVFTTLYFHSMKHDPHRPDWSLRDRLVLSNGHICPVLYATMCHAGYGSVKEFINNLRKFGSKFQGHPHREFFPALETSSGPLGSGLSQAVGMALADRIDNGRSSSKFFFCMLGDGELNEGNNWEAIMLAGKEKIHNLIAIVDRNNIQIDGFTEDIMPLEPFAPKWESWNWHVQEIDGHNYEQIAYAINQAKAVFNRPSVIIARTIPGKGVPFIERRYEWHGKPPNAEEAKLALEALRSFGGRIKSEHH